MERVFHFQMYLEISIIWSVFTSLAQQAITQRQSLSGSYSPVLMWSCAGANQNLPLQGKGCGSAVISICHKCGLLPKGQPACLASGDAFLISRSVPVLSLVAKCKSTLLVALGLAFSWMSSWVWLNAWLKCTKESAETCTWAKSGRSSSCLVGDPFGPD